MATLEHGSDELGRIHARNNDKKFFCYFTGFLEGIAASGYVEQGEAEPLIAECNEFVRRVADYDASDIIQDFEADLLDIPGISGICEVRIKYIDPICDKSSLNRFLGYCFGVSCDGVIKEREAIGILEILSRNPRLCETIGVRQVQALCADAVADGIVDARESSDICRAISEIVGDCYADTGLSQAFGVANFPEVYLENISSDLEGRELVLTGNFQTRPRSEFEEVLKGFGAIVSRSVTKKTDFVVVGGEAARDWIEANRGLKLRKAQGMFAEHGRPNFLSEAHLLRLINASA